MTSRERVIRAVEFTGPDRLPTMHSTLPGAVDRHGSRLEDVYARFPSDFAGQSGKYGGTADNPHYQKGTETDEWGCTWVNPGLGQEGQVKGHPLADWHALETYQPPEPLGGNSPEPKPRESFDRYVLWGGCGGRLWERMHFLRGYEQLLMDVANGRAEVERLRDLVLEHTLIGLEKQLQCDIDGISYMDDWGTQTQLMIRPDEWRRLFKPAYKAIADRCHAAGKHFYFHTDGHTLEILEDFIEIGIDVLNPQFSCHDLAEYAEVCRGRICVSADVDRQYVLAFGTPQEVRDHVREIWELFATPQGGLIAHGEAGPEVPLENVEAMYEAFREFSP